MMKGKTKVAVVSVILVAAFGYLVFLGMQEGSMYYLDVGEFFERFEEVGSNEARVNGKVISDSVSFEMSTQMLSFMLKDVKGAQTINVQYKGPPPDLLKEDGVTVVVEGAYNSEEQKFIATTLLVKCPSKYEKKDKRT